MRASPFEEFSQIVTENEFPAVASLLSNDSLSSVIPLLREGPEAHSPHCCSLFLLEPPSLEVLLFDVFFPHELTFFRFRSSPPGDLQPFHVRLFLVIPPLLHRAAGDSSRLSSSSRSYVGHVASCLFLLFIASHCPLCPLKFQSAS